MSLLNFTAELEHIDKLLPTTKAETICHVGDVRIVKTKFKVAGTNESAKTSGNRCIVAWHPNKQLVYVLLVYGKTDIGGSNETEKWQSLFRENYPEYAKIL